MDPLDDSISWKILMVDDDEDDYELVKNMLVDAKRGKCIVDWASTYEAGRQALLNGQYDAVLMDYNLEPHNGLDLIREAAAAGFQPPFILYTGHGSYQVDQEALRAGATFYLTKGETSALMLERGIRYAIERKQIEAALQQRTKELEAARAGAENEKLRLQAVMEALPVGVAITDELGGNFENNRAFELVWGTPSPPPFSGVDFANYKAWWADTGEEVRPEEWASVQATRQGRIIAGQFLRIRRLDGTYGYALNAAAPIRDLEGKIVGSAVAIRDVTELWEAQAALRASEERFRSVLDNSRDVIYSVNLRTGRFEYISPSVEQVMGFSAAELMALDSAQSLAMVHPNDVAGLKEGMGRLLETSLGELEYRQRTKDGGYRWLSNYASIVYDEAGQPLYRQGNIRDITDLKQAEVELSESEAKYRNLFNTMDEAFCIIEVIFDAHDHPVDYRFLETNAVFEAQTGLYEAQGKLMRQMAPVHEEYWFQIYGKIALTGEPVRFVNEARALKRWYDVYAYRVGKPEDRHVAILFNDISRHKLLEAELMESERRYRELVQFAPAAIYELDFRTQRFLSVNDAMCTMSGYSREELLQMTPAQLLDEPSQRLFQKRTVQWLAGEKPDESVEYRILAKGGRECYGSLNVTFNRDETGRPCGATVIAYDITERRRADLLLREGSDAIQEYSRRLEQSNHELENFAFIASHDLQEPLRKIEKFGGLLMDLPGMALGETERLYIERMQDAVVRMRQMIDDLLALSRVSSAGNPFADVDLNRVLRAVQEDLETRIKPVDGKIISGDLPLIQADPIQMHQLFQNLIGNAIKFRQPGVPPVISISARLDSEQSVTLQVADNGIGFDNKYVSQIFEPFKRLHGRSEYEGNGIGLAICKRIVERHHGSITAHSQPDQGATFTITLPLKQN